MIKKFLMHSKNFHHIFDVFQKKRKTENFMAVVKTKLFSELKKHKDVGERKKGF